MKKFIALFLVLTFVIAFAASCGKDPVNPPDVTVDQTTTKAAETTGFGTTTTGAEATTPPAETTTEPDLDKYKEIKEGAFLYRIMRDENGKFSHVLISKYYGEDSSITIPSTYNYKNEALNVTEIGVLGNIGAQQGLTSVKELTIPGTVRIINSIAFFSAINLEKINFAEGLETISDMAFWCCTGLKEFALPSTLREIGANAFSGCESLETLVIPSSVETIGAGAFSGCTSLKTVTIPEKFRAQEAEIFNGCPNVTINYVG